MRKLSKNYIFLLSFIYIIINSSCNYSQQKSGSINDEARSALQNTNDVWWKREAERMVNNQIISRGIRDENVIRVMKNTPRHLFVAKELSREAYDDNPLPIGKGQTISQPYIVALMTELLELKGKEKVLEIGTGSGYQAAILSQLADSCYTIELIKSLADNAGLLLKRLNYNNVAVKCDDGYKGWTEHAPFDCIIITAASEDIPEKLAEQLKTGGRMVLPVGKYDQELILIIKTTKGLIKKEIIPVRFVPMVKPY